MLMGDISTAYCILHDYYFPTHSVRKSITGIEKRLTVPLSFGTVQIDMCMVTYNKVQNF